MNTLLKLKSILLGVGLGLVAALAQAASGVGPYYATPSWDQSIPAATRFLVLTNMNSEAVLDRETGLVWEKSPSTSADYWLFRSAYCLDLSKGGKKGWRMPTVEELASLVDPSASSAPFLPAGHPFTDVQSSVYWSATTNALDATNAWVVNFNGGFVVNVDKSTVQRYVWCVRGGKGPDVQ